MQEQDQIQFGELMAFLCASYHKELSPLVVEMYWRALEKYSIAEINRAIDIHIGHPENSSRWPMPGDFVRHIEGGTQSQALLAWTKVLEKGIKRVGQYSSVVFDDAIIHAVITDMGGWVQLCRASIDELPFIARQFEQRYSFYLTHRPAEYPRKLIGLTEQYNAMNGFRIEAPRYIGDEQKAKLIFESNDENVVTLSVEAEKRLTSKEEAQAKIRSLADSLKIPAM
jgi:hypothetical protein